MATHDAPSLAATRLSLLGRMKNWSDQASWQEFFDAYWSLIYGVARKAGLTDAEAQDAVQDTIIAVVQHIREFQYDRKRCSFRSWLRMIARQRIVWQLRRRLPQAGPDQNTSTGTGLLERVPDPESLDTDAIWEAEWQQSLLSMALDQVKAKVAPRQFQIFDLYVLQEWPVADVVRTLRVSRVQVYLAKYRVGGLLKKVLRQLEEGRQPGSGQVPALLEKADGAGGTAGA